MLISLIKIFNEGPDVSLNGSPTVSPTTVALWLAEPLPPKLPSSTYFLALSHAPPALAINTARTKPHERPPISRPSTPAGPNKRPTTTGATIASIEGNNISCCAPLVEISTQRAYSGSALPSRIPFISVNWRRTSSTIFCAARPTAFIVSPQNRKAIIAPMKMPIRTLGFIKLTW